MAIFWHIAIIVLTFSKLVKHLIIKNMDKKTSIAVIVSIALVFFIATSNGLVGNLFSGSVNNSATINMQQTQTPTQIQIKDVKIGEGEVASVGKDVTVNYTGIFTDGKKFDSSRDPGRTPFTFKLGAGQVIKGWDVGVDGMRVGGTRILMIPPELGYGSQDYGPIPGNSTLIFEVELLEVK